LYSKIETWTDRSIVHFRDGTFVYEMPISIVSYFSYCLPTNKER